MENGKTALLSALLGYFFGAVPTGVIVGKMYGVDVRQVGSGKTGGTNVARAAGRNAAIITIIGDIAKGLLPVWMVRQFSGNDALSVALAGLFSVIGHNASIWLKFKGGAGTMTGTGSLFALDPILWLATSPVPILMTFVTRTSSIGSLMGSSLVALLGFIFVWLGRLRPAHLVYCVGVAILSWYAHRGNIERLRAGTERRHGDK